LDQITSAQLSEWEAYDKIDPIGSWRDDYRIAVLDSLIVNIVSKLYAKKGHPPKEVSPTEFMPNWLGEVRVEQRQKQSVEEMKGMLMALASAANKKEERDRLDKERSKRPPMAFKARPPIRKPE
jgi:hypothetical protein